MDEVLIDEADVVAFREKLGAWADGLDDADRAILQLIMVRAFPESEVEGFGIAIENRPDDDVHAWSSHLQVFDVAELRQAIVGRRYRSGGHLIF